MRPGPYGTATQPKLVQSLHAYFLPDLTTPEALAGGTVVVIDVLRASTVIVHALAAGAREVIPCLEVDDARRTCASLPPGQAILGGERGGLPIEGFDLGNSPGDYTAERISGKTLVFTTSNGTRAMQRCRQAKRVLIGALVNASAVVEAIAGDEHIHLLCAGTRGEVTREDVLVAGLFIDRLLGEQAIDSQPAVQINDQALIARECFRSAMAGFDNNADPAVHYRQLLRQTQGGRNLIALALDGDIDDAARIDHFAIVPRLDISRWTINAGNRPAW